MKMVITEKNPKTSTERTAKPAPKKLRRFVSRTTAIADKIATNNKVTPRATILPPSICKSNKGGPQQTYPYDCTSNYFLLYGN